MCLDPATLSQEDLKECMIMHILLKKDKEQP